MGVDVHILIPGLCDTDQGSVTQTKGMCDTDQGSVTQTREGDQAN